jgi:hypothetical protein
MRRFFSFWWGCSKIAVRGSLARARAWQWLIGIPVITGLLGYVAAQHGRTKLSTGYPIADGVLTAACALIATWSVIFCARLLNVPVMLDQQKLDAKDLEPLLGGVFYQGTFMYAGDITCKQYAGRFEIDQLKHDFTSIKVRAPRNSRATIRINFMNSRQTPNARYCFYYRDARGKNVPIENIYEDHRLYLDENSCFQLTFSCNEDYIIDDHASVGITISAWTK